MRTLLAMMLLMGLAFGQSSTTTTTQSGNTSTTTTTINTGRTQTTYETRCAFGDSGGGCHTEEVVQPFLNHDYHKMLKWCKANGHKINKWNNKGQAECQAAWEEHNKE